MTPSKWSPIPSKRSTRAAIAIILTLSPTNGQNDTVYRCSYYTTSMWSLHRTHSPIMLAVYRPARTTNRPKSTRSGIGRLQLYNQAIDTLQYRVVPQRVKRTKTATNLLPASSCAPSRVAPVPGMFPPLPLDNALCPCLPTPNAASTTKTHLLVETPLAPLLSSPPPPPPRPTGVSACRGSRLHGVRRLQLQLLFPRVAGEGVQLSVGVAPASWSARAAVLPSCLPYSNVPAVWGCFEKARVRRRWRLDANVQVLKNKYGTHRTRKCHVEWQQDNVEQRNTVLACFVRDAGLLLVLEYPASGHSTDAAVLPVAPWLLPRCIERSTAPRSTYLYKVASSTAVRATWRVASLAVHHSAAPQHTPPASRAKL